MAWFDRLRSAWGKSSGAGAPDPSTGPAPDSTVAPEDITIEQAEEIGREVRPEDYVGGDAEANQRMVRDGFLTKARQLLGKIPLGQDTVAMYFVMIDKQTPTWVKGTVGAALAYFVMPIDAVADVIPFVGLVDDAGVLAATLSAVSAFVTDKHQQQAQRWIAGEPDPELETDSATGTPRDVSPDAAGSRAR